MNKEAFYSGFIKAGRELGLDSFQLNSLWKQALNYPLMNDKFNSMSNDKLANDVEFLDTISNLEKINSQVHQYK